MTEIYYIQNEKQYKKILINLIREYNVSPDELEDFGICGCDYLDVENECLYCESNNCLLIEHLENKDVIEHIDIYGTDVYFPAILVLADTYEEDEKITLISVGEAKANTKYGYNGYW